MEKSIIQQVIDRGISISESSESAENIIHNIYTEYRQYISSPKKNNSCTLKLLSRVEKAKEKLDFVLPENKSKLESKIILMDRVLNELLSQCKKLNSKQNKKVQAFNSDKKSNASKKSSPHTLKRSKSNKIFGKPIAETKINNTSKKKFRKYGLSSLAWEARENGKFGSYPDYDNYSDSYNPGLDTDFNDR